MSNKRRKRLGTEKIKRNRLIRVARGARKLGTNLPGDGRAFRAPAGWKLSADLESRRQEHRDDFTNLVMPYFSGTRLPDSDR